jgi:hypothetical protein
MAAKKKALGEPITPSERGEMEAAITAHHQWLKEARVVLPASPEKLAAWQVFAVAWQGRGEAQGTLGAVLANLHALCGLRTREALARTRQERIDEAAKYLETAEPAEQALARYHSELLKFGFDDSHIVTAEGTLVELAARSRYARRALDGYTLSLKKRHKTFAQRFGSRLAVVDIALARWLAARCVGLERDIEFFLTQAHGQQLSGHTGPADGKAWHRVRGESLLRLQEAGVGRSARADLFPPTRVSGEEPRLRKGQRRRRLERDDLAIKRAKQRVKSDR